jgi:lysophospholipase L1-like esterase
VGEIEIGNAVLIFSENIFLKAVSFGAAFCLLCIMKTYLALGDSYTIGEQVLLSESFPYQTVQLLRNKNIEITAPEIIAKTGWTTDELNAAIQQQTFLQQYDYVSLLIGVNNQYRGRTVEEYENEFEILLKQAIVFAGNKLTNVFVLSIPDWGVTPFAADRDVLKIANEIDEYNAACKKITSQFNCVFVDITTSQRACADDAEMLASDGLHASRKEYAKWAVQLANAICKT